MHSRLLTIHKNLMHWAGSGFLLILAVALLPASDTETPKVYLARREMLAQKHADGPIVVFGYREHEAQSSRSGFRQQNDFYYLTGWNEPGATLLILPQKRARRYREILFLPKRNAHREQWTGSRLGPGEPGAGVAVSVDDLRDIEELSKVLGMELPRHRRLYSVLPSRKGYAEQPLPDRRERLGKLAPGFDPVDVSNTLASMRAVKSAEEIEYLRKAAEATMAAHRAAWHQIRPGIAEREIAGRMIATLMAHGCQRLAYTPIVGAGRNTTILHYDKLAGRLRAGDLVLVDVGGEYEQYAADIARTVPVSGRFTSRQRKLYDIVLGAQRAAIKAVKPGMRLAGDGKKSLHRVAKQYFDKQTWEGETELSRYFPHGLGHHVGLAVHDPADAKTALEPGMVITIEPGLYLPDEGLGIRVEDMVLVTEDGAEVLTSALPKEVDEIEKIMQHRSAGARVARPVP